MVFVSFNRILEIDQANLLAVVEPNVITAVLQHAVEQLGLPNGILNPGEDLFKRCLKFGDLVIW